MPTGDPLAAVAYLAGAAAPPSCMCSATVSAPATATAGAIVAVLTATFLSVTGAACRPRYLVFFCLLGALPRRVPSLKAA